MRCRHSGWTTEEGKVLTHCTIDTGEGTAQTAITFRSSEDSTDILTVTRPFPDSTESFLDSANSSKW